MKQHAAIKKNYREIHNRNIAGSQMKNSIKRITKLNNRIDLGIMEALLIKEEKPIINIQANHFDRTIKIFWCCIFVNTEVCIIHTALHLGAANLCTK